VADGVLGRLRFVRANFGFLLRSQADVRARPELDGGALMDVGCYCVSGARLLAGEPERVLGEQVLGETGVDMAFHGTLRFPRDVVAQFDCSFLVPRGQQLEVVGDEGSLLVEAPWRVEAGGRVLLRRGGSVEELPVPSVDSYRLQLDNLADAAEGLAPALLGREDALGQARTIEALYRAADTERAVALRP
jgi:xylose dehydrogenase (NAD/NADP)